MQGPLRERAPERLILIETLGWRPGEGAVRARAHLARMERGAAALGLPFDAAAARARLDAVSGRAPLRLRLTLDRDGALTLETAEAGPVPGHWRAALAGTPIDADDPWRRHKTSARAIYDAARRDMPGDADEVIFLNQHGRVAEGTITNVFLERDGLLLTPPVADGALPGILRAALLDAGRARESPLAAADLRRGGLWLGNSLRGLIAADLMRENARF